MLHNRPAGVNFTAVVQILGSVLALLMSLLFLFLPMIEGSRAAKPSLSPGLLYGEAAVFGIFAVLGLLTAIGLFRMRSWARYSTLVFSPMPILMGLSLAAVFIIIPMLPGRAEDLRAPGVKVVEAVMVMLGLGIAALGVFWLYYFNRATTKLAFANAAGNTRSNSGIRIDGRNVPTSIALIAALALFSAVGSLPSLFFSSPALIFGLQVRGLAAKAAYVLLILLQLYAGIALLQLRAAGRVLAIALHSLWLVNSAVVAFAPTATISKLLADAVRTSNTPTAAMLDTGNPFVLMLMRGAGFFGMAMSVIILYFLLTRGWAFRNGEAAQAAA